MYKSFIMFIIILMLGMTYLSAKGKIVVDEKKSNRIARYSVRLVLVVDSLILLIGILA